MRCRSFLLVLSSARTRSSDKENKIRTKIFKKSEPNFACQYLATNICSTFADRKQMWCKLNPNIAWPKHLLLGPCSSKGSTKSKSFCHQHSHKNLPTLSALLNCLPFCCEARILDFILSVITHMMLMQVLAEWLLGHVNPTFSLFANWFLAWMKVLGWQGWCQQRSISGKFGTKFGFYPNLWQ